MKTRLLPALLLFGCVGVNATGTDTTQLSHAQMPVVRPTFYDPFGEFFIQLDSFIYGLFASQTHDSTEPAEINDLPLVTLTDDSDAYDRLLQP